MERASVGHAEMQAPQPVQACIDKLILPPGSPDSARSGQRATQITHTTPWAARHRDSSRLTGGSGRIPVRSVGPCGQTSTHARQNVHAPIPKSIYASPSAGCWAGWIATMRSGHASTQGLAQSRQTSAVILPSSHGGAMPNLGTGPDPADRPVRNARRDGSAGPAIYWTVVFSTKGSVSACAT